VVQVACGGAHTLFRTEEGRVYSAGLNDHGQLGLGDFQEHPTVQLVEGIERCTHIAAGNFHSVVVCDGEAFSFGKNAHGQLGIGNTKSTATPVKMETIGSKQVTSAACGGEHTLLIEGDTQAQGNVWAFGLALSGQLGHGSSKVDLGDHKEPRSIIGLQNLKGSVVQVEAGVHHSAALLDSGEVFVWGDGHSGQIGGGNMFDEATPVKLEELSGQSIRHIACGGSHSVFVNNFGQVWATGLNSHGQLGVGFNQTTTAEPMKVEALKNQDVVRVSAGWQHTLVLTREGELYSWGHGLCGQLGLGTFNDEWEPEEIFSIYLPESASLKGISAGWEHSAAW